MAKKKKSSKKKAVKEVKKYYKKKEESAKKRASIDTARLQEDIANVYREAGITQTRAIEDYNRNIKNIEENKALDIASIKDYVSTQKTRTQEDLDTALAKENRRYSLEYDKINQDLAERGLTFSERKDERIAKESSAENIGDIQTTAERSFQDIARYEAAKTAELELKYGQQKESVETDKTRTLEDIINETNKNVLSKTRTTEDVASGLEENISELGYAKKSDISGIESQFEEQKNYLKNTQERNLVGV